MAAVAAGLAARQWDALGRQLAASRRAAGLNQERLARLAEYSRSAVANVETGRQRVPRDFWARCDSVLGTGTALVRGHDEIMATMRLGEALTAVAARQARLDPSQAGAPAAPEVSAAGPAGLESLRLRLDGAVCEGAVSIAGLDAWDQAVAAHGRATRSRSPDELLIELTADLGELDGVIRRARSVGSLHRLARVAAQLSGLVCLLLVKGDQQEEFRRWAGTARSAAGEAGDAAVLSWLHVPDRPAPDSIPHTASRST